MSKGIKLIVGLLATLLLFSQVEPLLAFAQNITPKSTITEIGSIEDNPMRVLKIIPGEYDFNNNGIKIESFTGVKPEEFREQFIEIETITMPEFIGKTTQINGYYDVIQIDNQYGSVIGKSTNGKYNKERPYSQIDFNSNNESAYNENDITRRKANEIIEFANSGQLVYFDESILTNTVMTQSNLNYLRTSIQGNYKSYTSAKITTPKVSDMEPKISLSEILQDKTKNRILFEVQANKTNERQINFAIQTQDNSSKNLKLFLDWNGNGIFSKDEQVSEKIMTTTETSMTTSIPIDFLGKLDWKIEFEKNGIKNYKRGEFIFKPTSSEDVKKIEVLQLAPGTGSLFNQYTQNQKEIVKAAGYELQITYKSITEVGWENSDLVELASEAIQFSKYDYIILGLDINNNWGNSEKNTVNEAKKVSEKLIEYAKSGGNILFTRQTTTANKTNRMNQTWTENFRASIGQARFYDFNQFQYGTNGNTNANIDLTGNKIPYVQQLNDVTNTKKIFGKTREQFQFNEHKQTNTNALTSYPFQFDSERVLGATGVSGEFQLNLEDSEIIPLYTLGNNWAQGSLDVKNNYSIYTKNNFTYMQINERMDVNHFELMLNLIVASERVQIPKPNTAPKLYVTGVPEYVLTGNTVNIPIQAFANDPDGDTMTIHSKLERVNNSATTLIDSQSIGANSDEIKKITFEKTVTNLAATVLNSKNEITGGDRLKLTVYAVDSHGNQSDAIIYEGNKTDNLTPYINIRSDGFQEQLSLPSGMDGYLLKDNAELVRHLVSEPTKIPGNSGVALCRLDLEFSVNNKKIAIKSEVLPTIGREYLESYYRDHLIKLMQTDAKWEQGINKVELKTTLYTNQGNCNSPSKASDATSGLFVDIREGKVDVEFVDSESGELLINPYEVTLASKQVKIDEMKKNENGNLKYELNKTAIDYTATLSIPTTIPANIRELWQTTYTSSSGAVVTSTNATVPIALSYANHNPKITYTFGPKQIEPVKCFIMLGLDDNQFGLDDNQFSLDDNQCPVTSQNTATLATNSYVKVAAQMQLQERPSHIIVTAPGATQAPTLYYQTNVGVDEIEFAPLPVEYVKWGKPINGVWTGIPTDKWEENVPADEWLPPSSTYTPMFQVSWSMPMGENPVITSIEVRQNPTGKNQKQMTITPYSNDQNQGTSALPDLF